MRLAKPAGGLDGSLNATRGSLHIGPCFDQRLDDKSRMSREAHVRFCESVGVRFPRATRPTFGMLRRKRSIR